MPLALNDDELCAVMIAAQPLHPLVRDQFLEAVANELAKHDVLGPGIIARVVREQQRIYLTTPAIVTKTGRPRGPGRGKYSD